MRASGWIKYLGVSWVLSVKRVGQLLKLMKETGERDKGKGGDRKSQYPQGTVIATQSLLDVCFLG